MKKFLIVGSQHAIGYREIIPLIKGNEVWLGVNNGDMSFVVPKEYGQREFRSWLDDDGVNWRSLGNSCWFTNIEHYKRLERLELTTDYDSHIYKVYDNYDAIEVSKVCDIPKDYFGVMGVPVTFLCKYCPEQFEIVGFRKGNDGKDLSVNGKTPFSRILIKRR